MSDYERLCAMEPCLRLKRFSPQTRSPGSSVDLALTVDFTVPDSNPGGGRSLFNLKRGSIAYNL